MLQYLLVDDRDGSVLAEAASPAHAARLLRDLELTPEEKALVSLVRLDHEQGRLAGVSSMVAMRPLSRLPARTARRPD